MNIGADYITWYASTGGGLKENKEYVKNQHRVPFENIRKANGTYLYMPLVVLFYFS